MYVFISNKSVNSSKSLIAFIFIHLKILECDMESCHKNVSDIRNVTFIIQTFEKKNQKREKNMCKSFEVSTVLFHHMHRNWIGKSEAGPHWSESTAQNFGFWLGISNFDWISNFDFKFLSTENFVCCNRNAIFLAWKIFKSFADLSSKILISEVDKFYTGVTMIIQKKGVSTSSQNLIHFAITCHRENIWVLQLNIADSEKDRKSVV